MVEGAPKNNATSIKEANFFVAGPGSEKGPCLEHAWQLFLFFFSETCSLNQLETSSQVKDEWTDHTIL